MPLALGAVRLLAPKWLMGLVELEPQARRLAVFPGVARVPARFSLALDGFPEVAGFGVCCGESLKVLRVLWLRQFTCSLRVLRCFCPVANTFHRACGQEPCQVFQRGSELRVTVKRFLVGFN